MVQAKHWFLDIMVRFDFFFNIFQGNYFVLVCDFFVCFRNFLYNY